MPLWCLPCQINSFAVKVRKSCELDKELSKLGYQVVRVNPKGTWELNADISQYSVSQTIHQVDEIIANNPNKQVIIIGHSLGGHITLIVAAKHPSISAAVSIMGPSCFVFPNNYQKRVVEWKKKGLKPSTRSLPKNSLQTRKFKLPYSFVEDAIKYDTIKIIKNITKPVLFIVSQTDTHFRPSHIQKQYNLANQPKKFVVKDVGHNYRLNPAEIKIINQEIITFLNEQNLS